MLVDFSQRWRARQSKFVPPSRRFNPLAHEVAEIPDDTTARAFVEREHYSGTYPAARKRYGLYRSSDLVGVAVFSHPANDLTLKRLPCDRLEGVELGRLVLLDDVAFNAETWFLARTFGLLRCAARCARQLQGVACYVASPLHPSASPPREPHLPVRARQRHQTAPAAVVAVSSAHGGGSVKRPFDYYRKLDRVRGHISGKQTPDKRTFAYFNRKEEPLPAVPEWEPDLRSGSIAVDLECLGEGE